MIVTASAAAAMLLFAASSTAPTPPHQQGKELAAACASNTGYSDPAPPAHIYGNSYYVGTCGISVILIVGPAGEILIDGGPSEAAPLVAANLKRVGVKLSDIKIILSSHEHYDHAGSLAELKKLTGARLYARAVAKQALQNGMPSAEDPQRDLHQGYPAVKVDKTVADEGRVRLGTIELTAAATPGHTPGSTSWSWNSCESGKCLRIVYADSLTPVSADSYRFSEHPKEIAAFRSTFRKIAAMRCDILLTPHPGASKMFDRLAGMGDLSNPRACADYAAQARLNLDRRLQKEKEAHN